MTDSSGEREVVTESALEPPEITLLAVANMALRYQRLIGGFAAVAGLAAAVVVVLLPDRYEAVSEFIPEGTSGITGFAGIAAELGMGVGRSTSGDTPEFYAGLVRSTGVLRDAATTTYRFATDTQGQDSLEGTLVDLYGIERSLVEAEIRAAAAELGRQVGVSINAREGTVSLTTAAPWRDLAVATNHRIIELVNDFNLGTRQSRAAAERVFVEGRLEETRSELHAAEQEFRLFLEQNRTYRDSPRLSFEAASLERQVLLRQEVLTTLAKSHEQARIEEVRNTPVITLIEDPADTVRSANLSVAFNTVLGILAGGLLGIIFAVTREFLLKQPERNPEEYEEFQDLITPTTDRVKRILTGPWRRSHG